MINNDKVSQAVMLYKNVLYMNREAEKAHRLLDSVVKTLSKVEFEKYAMATTSPYLEDKDKK